MQRSRGRRPGRDPQPAAGAAAGWGSAGRPRAITSPDLKTTLRRLTVHWWYDAFSRVTYTLKVWVEC
jgi:hypothetical protein